MIGGKTGPCSDGKCFFYCRPQKVWKTKVRLTYVDVDHLDRDGADTSVLFLSLVVLMFWLRRHFQKVNLRCFDVNYDMSQITTFSWYCGDALQVVMHCMW